jgi:hypothetical protein
LLFTDETNIAASDAAKFFVYGGLIVPGDALVPLDAGIAKIRAEAGYQPLDELKFDTRARPKTVAIGTATAAKDSVIKLCIDLGCKFIAYVVLHSIARKQHERMVQWGASHVIGRFNRYLAEHEDYGICIVDRLPAGAEYQFLTEKFCCGLQFPDDDPVILDRIKLFASSCSNASHASSAMDIVLGAFRYCINDPRNVDAAKAMMVSVTRMIWHVREGDQIHAMGRGLVFRPKEVKVASYKAEYEALLAHINTLIKDADF